METTSPRLIKRILPLTFMATRRDWDFAGACNLGEVSIGLTDCSPASCAMTKGTHEGGLARATRTSQAPSGSEVARPVEFVFRLFIVVDYMTGAGAPSDHLPTGTMNGAIGGASLNCGVNLTGELGRSAPQTAPPMSGV